MLRRQIQKAFKFNGLSVRPSAVSALESVLKSEDDFDQALEFIMKNLKSKACAGQVIDRQVVAEAIAELSRNEKDVAQGSLAVVDAFEMPSYEYNVSRRQFYKGSHNLTAKVYTQFFRERYLLIQQRVLRHQMFSNGTTTFGRRRVQGNPEAGFELTQIESLSSSGDGVKYVLGVLVRMSDGLIYLQDLNGKVKFDVSASADIGPGIFTEGCIVIVEGKLIDDVLIADTMCSPPTEPREQSLGAHGGLDFLRGRDPLSSEALRELQLVERADVGARFVILSDVHLDNVATLSKIQYLFQVCSEFDPIPSLFVFMGNFTERPFGEGDGQCGADEYAENFSRLGAILLKFPRILEDSHIIFVPGPKDPGGGGLIPRSKIPNVFTKAMLGVLEEECPQAQIKFCSNPCRVQYYSQEIVVFRENLISRRRRHSLFPPNEDQTIPENLVRTLVQQSHLCPFPPHTRPVQWAYDSALSLYPLPHVVITGDHYDQFEYEYEGCTVFNPGSFNLDFSFVMYAPAMKQVEFSKIDRAEEDDMEV
mmetsp:Transcript_10979/g.17986  ORF Transcript_10979/g.17986 Transcript_10979/m.17986 type:complete len:535 (+) Transcript_10979:7-1611(+)